MTDDTTFLSSVIMTDFLSTNYRVIMTAYLTVATRRDEVSVAMKGQEFGLKNVCFVARVEGELLLAVGPVPHDDVEVVGAGGEQRSGLVEVERIHAALVTFQLMSKLQSCRQRQRSHSPLNEIASESHGDRASDLSVDQILDDWIWTFGIPLVQNFGSCLSLLFVFFVFVGILFVIRHHSKL